MKLSSVKKRLHQRVLKKLQFKKATEGSKEITYELEYCGELIVTTDLPKGRNEIGIGLLSKIIKHQLFLTVDDYFAVKDCSKRFVDYINILQQQGITCGKVESC